MVLCSRTRSKSCTHQSQISYVDPHAHWAGQGRVCFSTDLNFAKGKSEHVLQKLWWAYAFRARFRRRDESMMRVIQKWRQKICSCSTPAFGDRSNQFLICQETKNGKWVWIGYILRKSPDNTTRQALAWTPQGKRRVGRTNKEDEPHQHLLFVYDSQCLPLRPTLVELWDSYRYWES